MSLDCDEQHPQLPPGFALDGYTVEKRIGGGGFSIVYLAREAETGERVALKEYMPRKWACREGGGTEVRCKSPETKGPFYEGRRLFFHEAKTLSTLRHPNIVRVRTYFRANGTVYMVMDYEKGTTLQSYIGRKGNLSERFLRTVFPPLLEGLRLMHEKGLLHLDIKPANIYLRPGGNPLLLDFGAAHRMFRSRRYQSGQVITPGFAPIEQLTQQGYVGPWTDVYAVGATLRTCIEGSPPPSAEERRVQDRLKPASGLFKRRYSRRLLAAVDWAMEVEPLHRPQSVDELLGALREDPPAGAEGMLERLASGLPWLKG